MISKKKCGIYRIYCRKNRQSYVGSSVQISVRWDQHRYLLRQSIHTSPYLQNAWNKYGEEVFTFKILEECSREVLHEREQYWIDSLQPKFNSLTIIYPRIARTPEQIAKFKASLTPERRKKLSDTARALWSDEEYRAKVTAAHVGKGTGRHNWSEEAKQSVAEAVRARSTGIKQSAETIAKRQTKLIGVAGRKKGTRWSAEERANRTIAYCKRGHLFEEGSYWYTGGRRKCKQCKADRSAEKANS